MNDIPGVLFGEIKTIIHKMFLFFKINISNYVYTDV